MYLNLQISQLQTDKFVQVSVIKYEYFKMSFFELHYRYIKMPIFLD
jgi:hypothetical protein